MVDIDSIGIEIENKINLFFFVILITNIIFIKFIGNHPLVEIDCNPFKKYISTLYVDTTYLYYFLLIYLKMY